MPTPEEPWRLDTTPATWTPRDDAGAQRLLLEVADIVVPPTFSWTNEADRRLVLGSYGAGDMSKWLQPPADQGCCGYCYAVATSGVLGDRLAIQSVTPREQTAAASAAPCFPTLGAPALSPVALAACVSAAHPESYLGCGGGAIDHTLGDFMERTGVQRCAAGDATAVKCPAASTTPPALPTCPADTGVVRARQTPLY